MTVRMFLRIRTQRRKEYPHASRAFCTMLALGALELAFALEGLPTGRIHALTQEAADTAALLQADRAYDDAALGAIEEE